MRKKTSCMFPAARRRRALTLIVALLVLTGMTMSGCASEPTPTNDGSGQLEPIVVPTMPDTIPGYLEVDPKTGLHMTGTPTVVDFDSYRLKVTGKVDHELSLTYDELRLLPKLTAAPDLVCAGYFEDHASWSGASLIAVLDLAGIQPDAVQIVLKSADGYSTPLIIQKAYLPENFLAYELEGQTLPVLQGFPVRAVIPGTNGNTWVKWLTEIVVS